MMTIMTRPQPQDSRAFERRAWRAVRARDARSDGAFVFAVTTTGVYCRPSCGARRPLRRNVRFFRTVDEAERAGFRACRRCRPGEARGESFVGRARAILDARLDAPVTLAALARAVGVSVPHLQRTFRREVGVSPKAYHDARRLERWKALARAGEPVLGAAHGAGFGSSRSLYTRARAGLGMTPAAYAKGGRGEAIAWASGDTRAGRVLVARTERGICALFLGDDDRALESELRREFPAAALAHDAAGLRGTLDAIRRAMQEGRAFPVLDLDLRGTEFQRRVWRALAAIPRGETRTYGQIAEGIGRRSAARAVGGAIAANRVGVLVPCHRAVRSDGGIGGYRWGVERKRALLEGERAPGGEGSTRFRSS